MAYKITREYAQDTVTNQETGKTITQWDRVTLGKSRNVWDVSEILWDGEVRLHRQIPTSNPRQRGVTYRRVSMDQLTIVSDTPTS